MVSKAVFDAKFKCTLYSIGYFQDIRVVDDQHAQNILKNRCVLLSDIPLFES